MSYQQILIQGNCTRDAEVRQVGQSQVAKIGVAVSEKYKGRDGQIQESTEFFDVEIWDKSGVYPYLTKGQSVLIVGQQKTDKWQDQNGQNRESKKVRAQVVQLCGPRPQAQAPASTPAQSAYQAPAPAPTYQAPAPPQYQQPAPAYPPQPQYQAPAPPPQPTYQAPVPPAPQYQQPAPPPVNDPAYTQQMPGDLPFSQSPGVRG